MPHMMRSSRTSAHLLVALLLGGAISVALVACSTGGNTGGDDAEPDAAGTDNDTGSVCGDGSCEPDEIDSCEDDCGAPDCNNNDVCDAGEQAGNCDDCESTACNFNDICDNGEVSATCADCFADPCNNNGICEGGETPGNCANDCTAVSDCGGCEPSATECITDFCGEDQECLQACLPSGFDCEGTICPLLELDPISCTLLCAAFGG